MKKNDVLVVSATRAEAAHVPPGFELLVTGIGKVAAAVAVASAVVRRRTLLSDGVAPRPLLVVNIGTAGALRDEMHGLYVPSRVLNHDISSDVLRSMGYPVDDDLAVDEGDGSVLATGDAFVSDPSVRAALAARAGLVDMEGFAVAHACATLGVRYRLVKHVSDNADETALNWADRIDASARVLGQWLERFE